MQIAYEVDETWNAGFNSFISITNDTGEDIQNWTFTFDFDAEITDIWRGTVLSQEGSTYTIGGASYNQTLKAGETIKVGFTAQGDPSTPFVSSLDSAVMGAGQGLPLSVDYRVAEDWGGGFNAYIELTNTSNQAISDWTYFFETSLDVRNVWGATYRDLGNDLFQISGADYNLTIDPGETARIGLTFRGSSDTRVTFPDGGSASGSGASTNSVQDPDEPRISADYRTGNDWGGGFVGYIELTNEGRDDLGNWTYTFELDANITKVWGGELVSKNGNQYTIKGTDYNVPFDSGETVTVGFTANGSSNASITLAELPPPPTPDAEIVLGPDATAQDVMEAIEDVAPGGVVRLQAGTYVFDETIVINRSDVSLVGAGSGQTKIVSTVTGESAISVESDGLPLDTIALASSANEGARSITLASGHGVEVGDFLWLDRPNTNSFFNEIGDDLWREDFALRTSLVRVNGVNGNTINLENPLYFDFPRGQTTVRKLDVVENVTLSGFTVDQLLGDSDPTDYTNTLPEWYRVSTVELDGTYNASLSDITINDPGSNGFSFLKSLKLDGTDLSVDGAHNKGGGGNGRGFWINDVYESDLSNLEAVATRHAIVFSSYYSAANNNVHATYIDRDINFHGGRDKYNTVTIDRAEMRTDADDFPIPAVIFNDEGANYGAPTDPSVNTTTFKYLLGGRDGDEVFADPNGGYLDGRLGDDTLYGSDRKDTLIGGEGNDSLVGGLDWDHAEFSGKLSHSLIVDLGNGRTAVFGPDGEDTLVGIEELFFDDRSILVGSALTGGANPSLSIGTDGNDTRTIGSSNASTVYALLEGFDTVKTWIDYTLLPGTEVGEALGSSNIDIVGTDFDNKFLGNSGRNRLDGLDGNDTFFGRDGNDTLNGGAGNDTFTGGNGNDYINGGSGTDEARYFFNREDYAFNRIDSNTLGVLGPDGGDTVTNVETLVFADGSRASVDSLLGNALDGQVILGTDANDILTLTGSDQIAEGLGGYDTVRSRFDTTLGVTSERLELTGNWAVDGTGTDGDNDLFGNDSDNELKGLGGNDEIYGRFGNDTLIGGSGADDLNGQAGQDYLDGGSGNDLLSGGDDADRFRVSAGLDTVLDFNASDGDRVVVSHINGLSYNDLNNALQNERWNEANTLSSRGIDVRHTNEGAEISLYLNNGDLAQMHLEGFDVRGLSVDDLFVY